MYTTVYRIHQDDINRGGEPLLYPGQIFHLFTIHVEKRASNFPPLGLNYSDK